MTTKYQCDRCGEIMDFDDDKSVVINVGAGRGDASFESNKQMDLCPKCYIEVERFVSGLKEKKK